MNKVIIISGPTATGKTSLSIEAAKLLKKAEIINFDSLLFYKELSIGTARPTVEEMSGIVHHLVGTHSIKGPINASQFIELATPIIDQLHSRSIVPILVGGSAFYIRALIKGMYQSESIPDELKERLNKKLKKEGIEYFWNYLEKNDPNSQKNLHINDYYRIIRAVEYHIHTGSPLSEQKTQLDSKDPYDFSKELANDHWQLKTFYLDIPKQKHWEIINKRTESMLSNGLVQEVRELLELGHSGKEKPLQSIGYKETQSYINGQIKDLNALKERISISTRQLAKGQRTFFKKVNPKTCINPLTEKEHFFEELNAFNQL